MFIFNLKINKNSFFKIIIAICSIVCIGLMVVAIYKIYEQFRSDFHVFRTRANLSEYAKMIRSAIWSAFWGRLGKHKIYKPGWFIKK